jgi:hypothetical protein
MINVFKIGSTFLPLEPIMEHQEMLYVEKMVPTLPCCLRIYEPALMPCSIVQSPLRVP